MILTGNKIIQAHEAGEITLDPFTLEHVNPNSYDLRLGSTLGFYDLAPRDGIRRAVTGPDGVTHDLPVELDMRKDNPLSQVEIPEEGFVLLPGKFYLGHTMERAGSSEYVTLLDGRSSIARLGMFTHFTAGFGDLGFDGQWTLEIMVAQPLRVYAGTRVCQVSFHEVSGQIGELYDGKYKESMGVVASRSHEDIPTQEK
jgi:dCTP deaminase